MTLRMVPVISCDCDDTPPCAKQFVPGRSWTPEGTRQAAQAAGWVLAEIPAGNGRVAHLQDLCPDCPDCPRPDTDPPTPGDPHV